MVAITCECGFKAENDDHYKVEAEMWHHAMKDHGDMLKGMTVEQLEEVIKKNDQSMGM